MNQESSNNIKTIGLIIAVVVILGIIAATVLLGSGKKSTSNTNTTDIQTSPSPQPTLVSGIEYTGLENFLTHGVSQDQLTGLTFAIKQYATTSKQSIQKVTIVPESIVTFLHDPNSAIVTDYLTFTTQINGSIVNNAKMEYTGISAIRLYIYDGATDKVIYDSKKVDFYDQ